jgi:2-polyprenyl-3-methyl-5-hydroxy-6-metoxy-1,4-benzoquinol methylase
MFESIIEQFQQARYDFRETANPQDPLIHLFDEWVDYYRLKWAIAHTLNPSSILEIGVRFGYSAAAFLNGSPDAHYVGIDLDSDQFGGVKGAIQWAEKITRSFNADFLINDTQKMQRFPGEIYDLIHVDGQQDGDGSFHDLELAFQQGRFVLVDGYFWTRQNFTSVSDFLLRYADLIEWYGVIPGYAGELLIKVSEHHLAQMSQHRSLPTASSLSIRQTYTTDYYTQDCGGYDSYKKFQGKKLEDPRLQAVAAIASAKQSGRLLDLGCGRGELTYFFAQRGFEVSAIDYSESAISLAKKCFEDEPNLQEKVQFYCDSVCTVQLSQSAYDLAVASDVIEHLSVEEVETLYQRVSQQLKPDGLFIVHTAPNLWSYQYDYPRKRKIAASVGAFLPAQPRTRYELLMHINEQSPRVMKRQLTHHFKHVLVWLADPSQPGGSLLKKFSKSEVRSAPSLFAIASHQPIDRAQIAAYLEMQPLPEVSAHQIELKVTQYPTKIVSNQEFSIEVELLNRSESVLNSFSPHPVHISYHWMDQQAQARVVTEGERTRLFPPLAQSSGMMLSPDRSSTSYQAQVWAPQKSGSYVLRVTLVQEAIRWFDAPPINLAQDIALVVHES